MSKFRVSDRFTKRFAVLLFLLGIFCIPVFPANRNVDLNEAKKALSKAIAFQREAKDLSLQFKAKVYNSALDKNEEYEGKLWIKDSVHFRLEIPSGTYVSDGKNYWEYHKQNKQVVIRKAKDLEDKPLPGDVMLRFLDSEPLAIKTSKIGGKTFFELSLDPSRAMKSLDSLVVFLDPKNYSLQMVQSRDVSGNESKYTVVSIKRNRGLKEDEFVFLPPKGSDIVDMRE